MRLLITVILLFTTSSAFAQQNNCDSIVWSGNRKLTWADYKGQPVMATRVAATTNYNFLHRWHVENNVLTGKVICIFSPCRSWSRNKTSAELLTHEQGHFDLAEYFRRVYNKRILESTYTPQTLRRTVIQIYIDIQEECERMQEIYDTETYHGLIADKQAQWLDKISGMLDAMQRYDDAQVTVDLK